MEVSSMVRRAYQHVGLVAIERNAPSRRALAVVLLALLLFVVAVLVAWRSGSRLEELAVLGYPGVFLVMLIAGAGTLLPLPSLLAVLMAGALWNPVLVGLVAGLGNATGELVGYAAGRVGVAVLADGRYQRWRSSLARLVERYGFFAILTVALVPNPLFDFVGLLAGTLGYPVRRFWLAAALGNVGKYVAYAYLGNVARWWIE